MHFVIIKISYFPGYLAGFFAKKLHWQAKLTDVSTSVAIEQVLTSDSVTEI